MRARTVVEMRKEYSGDMESCIAERYECPCDEAKREKTVGTNHTKRVSGTIKAKQGKEKMRWN